MGFAILIKFSLYDNKLYFACFFDVLFKICDREEGIFFEENMKNFYDNKLTVVFSLFLIMISC